MVNIRPRYPQYRSMIFVRYGGSGGLIGTEGAKGIWGGLCVGKFVVLMLARTANSHPTPSHPPDVGGDIPAAAAHSSETLELKIIEETRICSCLPRPRSPWFKEGRRWQRGSSSAGRVCPHMLERGPQVDSQRIQTVVTKRESESFCVHNFIKLSLVIKDNLC